MVSQRKTDTAGDTPKDSGFEGVTGVVSPGAVEVTPAGESERELLSERIKKLESTAAEAAAEAAGAQQRLELEKLRLAIRDELLAMGCRPDRVSSLTKLCEGELVLSEDGKLKPVKQEYLDAGLFLSKLRSEMAQWFGEGLNPAPSGADGGDVNARRLQELASLR